MRKFVQKVTKRCLQLTKIESPPIECYLPNIHEMAPFILKVKKKIRYRQPRSKLYI